MQTDDPGMSFIRAQVPGGKFYDMTYLRCPVYEEDAGTEPSQIENTHIVVRRWGPASSRDNGGGQYRLEVVSDFDGALQKVRDTIGKKLGKGYKLVAPVGGSSPAVHACFQKTSPDLIAPCDDGGLQSVDEILRAATLIPVGSSAFSVDKVEQLIRFEDVASVPGAMSRAIKLPSYSVFPDGEHRSDSDPKPSVSQIVSLEKPQAWGAWS